MKTLITMVIVLVSPFLCKAQTYNYDYDANGNRVARAHVSKSKFSYGIQYAGTIGFMGYNPFDYKGSPKKALIASEKSLFFLLTLF